MRNENEDGANMLSSVRGYAGKDEFFGTSAREKFFGRYHRLNQQHSITSTKAATFDSSKVRPNRKSFENVQQVKERVLRSQQRRERSKSASSDNVNGFKISGILSSASLRGEHRRGVHLALMNENMTTPDLLFGEGNDKHTVQNPFVGSDKYSDEEMMEDLKRCGDMVLGDIPLEASDANSPRSKYISSCIVNGLNPRASLVLRKNTSNLKLQHMGMGDKMGVLLADSLVGLPETRAINIADNNLTDKGLEPLLSALVHIHALTDLDISQNKLGRKSAVALGGYLSLSSCALGRLTMHHADVDDFEAEGFVVALKLNRSVTYLDLSHNFIGGSESHTAVGGSKEMSSGGAALASLLVSPQCTINTLNLGWNMLRLQGAVDFCCTLVTNKSLTHLDLSYNAIGRAGGIALGEALMENTTLGTLILTHNSIDAMGCFTLCVSILMNKSLSKVFFDGNPIGEQGARVLMLIPAIAGARVDVSARGCNVTMQDPHCTFDFQHLCTEYSLRLDDPYERAVSLLLLQIVASHHSYIFSVAEHIGGSRAQALNLVPFWASDKREHFNEDQMRIESGLQTLIDACSDVRAATSFFHQLDADGSGELDRNEFSALLHAIGMDLDATRMDEVFDTYDTDQGGTIGLHEFYIFLRRNLQAAKLRLRDLTQSPTLGLSASPSQPYIPPKVGTLRLTVADGFARKEMCVAFCSDLVAKYRTITAVDRRRIQDITSASNEKVKLTTYGVSGSKIRYDEAYSMFADLRLESRNKSRILSTLLPQIENTLDARLLVAKCLNNNKADVVALKRTIGMACKPMLGIFNGFYVLDMGNSFDRYCLIRLMEASKTQEQRLIAQWASYGGPGCTPDKSQKGNGNSSFRNEMFNGRPITLSPAFIHPLPTAGILSFDFSSSTKPAPEDMVATDARVVKGLMSCFLLPQTQIHDALLKLKRYQGLAEATMKGNANTIYEASWSRAYAIGEAQSHFYNQLHTRCEAVATAQAAEDISASFDSIEDEKHEDVRKEISGTLDLGLDDFNSPGSVCKALQIVEKEQSIPEKRAGSIETITSRNEAREHLARVQAVDCKLSAHNSRCKDDGPVRTFEKYLAGLFTSEKISSRAKAARMCEVIEETFTRMWLMCKHLALIMEMFKVLGNVKKTELFGTYRVETCVTLFERLVDVHNIDLVLSELEADEVACLYCRLGWLHIYNPMKPEGSYNLNLGVAEERVVAKTLCLLTVAEPGENMTRKEFSWDRFGIPVPGWDLTKPWLTDAGMPRTGTFFVTYYCGEGQGHRGCAPEIDLRKSFMLLVHASEDEVITEEQRHLIWERFVTRDELKAESNHTTKHHQGTFDDKDDVTTLSATDEKGRLDLPGIAHMLRNQSLWLEYLLPMGK